MISPTINIIHKKTPQMEVVTNIEVFFVFKIYDLE